MEEYDTKLIVVLGMHRSGTSVIARGLQVMGVELGNRLMPPSEDNNSKGFWEDLDINQLNIDMLHSLKRNWHFLTPIQSSDVDTLCKNGYLNRAVELLKEKTAGIKVFGFKDPRLAKLLPFWKEVFAYGGWRADYILVIRHPLSVGQSLAKRDGFDFEKSYVLWLEHVVGSLVGTEGEKRILVEYDIFVQTPETELNRIANELQLSLNATELQHFLIEFLDPELRHTVYQFEDLVRDTTAPPLVQEIYSSLLDTIAGRSLLGDVSFKNLTAQWDKEFSRMRSTLALVDKLWLRVSTTTAERNALKAERKELLDEKAQLTQALMVKEETAQKLRAELMTIHQSSLWRWTKSIRKLLSLFQQGK